ncbi:D-TA family PLP-dependent enzyme [Granulosicoccus antarcticus]|uniref:D-threonine aldolase n=1 Tax=Granulosicoccus antarcticus IMCC3135 TaxID=1192854 RepID=A0A2Z2NHF3_9GAMM|nr:D-TA family PLP-dependent enzyme [Granulosicoccus antarcticus]ASJ70579.1 D-threonine aldolase [Granulosicoccus antarcticus IMCC3135]
MKASKAETPAVLIELDIVERNLQRAQQMADGISLSLRPHIKTHKLPRFAQRQIELGARGITCQKLGEAEVMADAGLDDIFVSYNILGASKLKRLKALHDRIQIAVAADNNTVIDGYSAAFTDSNHKLSVLVEIDTGGGRCGVQSAKKAVKLAKRIKASEGLSFGGIMTYPPRGEISDVNASLSRAKAALLDAGLKVKCVSNGGTPDLRFAGDVTLATEHRCGTYIYNDRMQVSYGHCEISDCALSVLATVISCPAEGRAVIDAGTKALAADFCDAPGYGHVLEYPDALVQKLYEEHGVLDFSACESMPEVGDKIRIIPNHVCVVSNLFDSVHLVRNGLIEETVAVAARGCLV